MKEYFKKISSFAHAKSDLLWAIAFAALSIVTLTLGSPYWSLYMLCFSLSAFLKHFNKWLLIELGLPFLAVVAMGWGLYDVPFAHKIIGSAILSAVATPLIISNYKKRKIKPAAGNK